MPTIPRRRSVDSQFRGYPMHAWIKKKIAEREVARQTGEHARVETLTVLLRREGILVTDTASGPWWQLVPAQP